MDLLEDDQLVVPVNPGGGIEQNTAASSHQRQRIMRRVMQAARLELLSKQPSECQIFCTLGVLG